jgi:ABC-type nitrate/sulfonate/bicarbonate transport system substrate-binding protein
MRVRRFHALDERDRPVVAALGAGLGEDTARVLGYMLLRAEYADADELPPATRLAVRIGTELNRETAATALERLVERGLLATTTVRTDTHGRPSKAWRLADPERATIERVYEGHGKRLAAQAVAIATETGPDGNTVQAEPERPSTDGTDRVAVALNWDPNGLHLPFFAARSAGHYERNGVRISIATNRGSSAAIACLETGTADIALAGAATVVRKQADGVPVVPLAVLFQRSMATLYTTREAFGEPFERVSQLRGKRIGLVPRSETGLLARLFLSQSDVLADTTVVDIAGEERAALRKGRADVVAGSIADPHRLQGTDTAVDSIVVADRFPIYGPTLVTTRGYLDDRRSRLEAFLAGTTAGWADRLEAGLGDGQTTRRDDRYRATETTDALNDTPLDDHDQRTFERAVRDFGTSAEVCTHGWGWQTVAGWQRLETALGQADLL